MADKYIRYFNGKFIDTEATAISTGAAQAGEIVALNSSGRLDPSLLTGTGSEVAWSDVTDKPTSSVIDIDDAVSKKHEHTNKSILDATEESFTTLLKNDIHQHTNKDILDLIEEAFTTTLKTAYDDAVTKVHTHTNKTILDATQESFTTVLKANYDEAYTKLHEHNNKTTLDKLSESGETGLPLWNGTPWPIAYVSYIAGESLNKGDIVILTETNVLMRANQSNLDHIYRVVGLVMDPVITGQSVRVLRYGVLEYVYWDFSANLQATQYLGTTGNLLTVCPTEGFMLIVGMPVGNNKLFVNLSMPIVL
jgi:hypothetical protein